MTRLTRWILRPVLAATGVAAALAAGEVAFRLWGRALVGPAPWALDLPDDHPGWEGLDEGQSRKRIPDPDFGVRPPLGTAERDEHGALANEYAFEKPPGVERLVFIGDSVTERGFLIDALRAAYGEAGREWWNTGVEGFGPEQEVLLHERFGRALDADHLILSFHNNDFQSTPIVYQDERGRLVTYQPLRPALRPNLWLLEHSYLYRAALHFYLRGPDGPGLVGEVRAALARLARLAEEDGARLSVVLLPIFVTETEELETRSRQQAIELFEELGLRWFDLLPALERALADGVDPQQKPGDYEHPSRELCAYFAEDLVAAGLLEP